MRFELFSWYFSMPGALCSIRLTTEFHLTISLTETLLLTGFELFLWQFKHVKGLILYPFSPRAIQSTMNFSIFMLLKLLAKILASAYDFGVNIVMLINITITINKTHNIYDLISAASTYDFVNIAMVIKHFHDLLMNYSCY